MGGFLGGRLRIIGNVDAFILDARMVIDEQPAVVAALLERYAARSRG